MNNEDLPHSIGQIISADSIYRMPLFQRQYAWTPTKHLKEFKEDIHSLMEIVTDPNSNTKVFLGAIILQQDDRVRSSSDSPEYIVIDGQQRLTTIFLTVFALFEHALEKGYKDSAENIKSRYLLSRGIKTKGQAKLFLTNLDSNQFDTIIRKGNFRYTGTKGKPRGPDKGTLTKAHAYVKEQIVDKIIDEWVVEYEKTPEQAFNLFKETFLERVVIANITLDTQEHDCFEVFDRLNTKGAKLETLDLVRNEIFRSFDDKSLEAEEFYDDYWEDFEKKLRDINKDISQEKQDKLVYGFFAPYGLCINPKIKKATIVRELRDYWKTQNYKPEEIVKEMSAYFECYKILLTGVCPSWIQNKILIKTIAELYFLQPYKTTYPFIMKCLYAYKTNELTPEALIECIKILESFIVRRAFAFEEEGTGMSAIFNSLWNKTKGDPRAVRKYMSSKTKSFPNDKVFKDGIENTELYGKKIEKYCLRSYELYLQKDHYETTNKKIESTDHIFPQSYKPQPEDIEEFSRLRHTWGNLLPMDARLNAAKGAKLDKSKLDLHSKFETTREFLKDYKEPWTLRLIRERNKMFSVFALKRWKSFSSLLDES